MTHFRNYFWKQGKPVGTLPAHSNDEISFKIITDPYRKRFSVEHYALGAFVEIVYDSSLFDFRHLKADECDAWQREYLDDTRSLIRNMDERIILIEENQTPETCKILSSHKVWIATQKTMRKSDGNPFNGFILYDKTDRPILIKHYDVDESGLFTTLLKEEWEHKPAKN